MGDRFAAGTPVRVVMTKWGDRPHWEFTGSFLGTDRHGDWVRFPAGTRFVRPGRVYVAPVDQASLVPRPGAVVDSPDVAWLATFHAPGGTVSTYVDVTTPARWHGTELRAVDLDLDVVRQLDDTVTLEDEDELAAHAVAYDYPPKVVAAARAAGEALLTALRSHRPPFDHDSPRPWLTPR